VGIAKILAIIRDLSDEQMALYVIVENLQRRNLNPIEEAKAFISLEAKGWTQEKIAKEVGCGLTRDIVAQRLRLLTFPTELQELVSRDTITATHAEILATLADDPALLKCTILKVTQQKLTTRETDQLVDELKKKQSLREQILEYLEDLVLQVKYLMDAPVDPSSCPLCQGDVVYKGNGEEEGLVCEDCGWKYPFNRGPLLELVERIKEARQTGKEPHASGR
jgi:ParB-like chromosome segregation protein Spo0J